MAILWGADQGVSVKLACNIDAKGKAVRLRLGLIELALAVVVAVASGLVRSPIGWGLSGILTLAGLFSIFEARAGWCALRALGFRTRV